jgi:hypothetical protein
MPWWRSRWDRVDRDFLAKYPNLSPKAASTNGGDQFVMQACEEATSKTNAADLEPSGCSLLSAADPSPSATISLD